MKKKRKSHTYNPPKGRNDKQENTKSTRANRNTTA